MLVAEAPTGLLLALLPTSGIDESDKLASRKPANMVFESRRSITGRPSGCGELDDVFVSDMSDEVRAASVKDGGTLRCCCCCCSNGDV